MHDKHFGILEEINFPQINICITKDLEAFFA
jgi:hypothetical protein